MVSRTFNNLRKGNSYAAKAFSSSSKSSGSKAAFYAVRKGRNPGIYHTWAKCKENTQGFKNAKYKKFATHKEALSFINNETLNLTKNTKSSKGRGENCNKVYDMKAYIPSNPSKFLGGGNKIVFFTDGSCLGNKGSDIKQKVGWGFQMLYPFDNSHIRLLQSYGTVPSKGNCCHLGSDGWSNNISELQAIGQVFLLLLEPSSKQKTIHPMVCSTKISNIEIHSDSTYAMNLMTGEHKPSTNYELVKNMLSLKVKVEEKGYKITFHKVKAHIGICYNEEVDELAKLGTTTKASLVDSIFDENLLKIQNQIKQDE